MSEHWARLWWDVRHIFSNDANPYILNGQGDFKGARRTGFEDITHAIKNIWVEWRRLK